MSIVESLKEISGSLPESVSLVAVSKTKPNRDIEEAYSTGQRIFGENRVQELAEKYDALPKDIEWHMIGHLQRNKVKYITPFVSLIHGVDSERLLKQINKDAGKADRVIDILLQIHIAKESSKFGFDEEEVLKLLPNLKKYENVKIRGLMGMATFTDNKEIVKTEFQGLKALYDKISKELNSSDFNILSMGMSGDYKLAIECGSTMVRIGSSIFGKRN